MKTTKRLFYCYLTIISMFLSSCATILSPEKGTYTLDSNPSGAQVFDENENQLGTTPFDLKKLNKKVRILTVKKEGYVSKDVSVYRKTKNGYLFLDAMLLCIPCIVDLPSGNLTTMEPRNTTVELKKSPKEYEQSILLAIDKVSYEKPDNIKGKINGATKTPETKGSSRTIGEIDYLESTVIEKMQKTYIDPVSVSANNNAKSGMGKAKLRVKPIINDLDFTLKGKSLKLYQGQQSMKCTWNFYRSSDAKEKLGSIVTSVNLTRGKGSNYTVLEELMNEAVADLLSVDTLYDFLAKNEKTYMAETKGKEIKLTGASKPNFESSKEMLKSCKEGVVTVMTKDGFGSGFIVSQDGYIVTNYHVAEGQKNNIQVKMNSNIKLKATVVKANEEYDLLLLKIDADELNPLFVGKSDDMETGDDVYAIGTPLETSLGQSITKGIISGKREISGMNYFQTDVSINSGNSGGPLINEKGEVVGVTTMKLSGKGIEGIGFCIPSKTVLEMLNIKF